MRFCKGGNRWKRPIPGIYWRPSTLLSEAKGMFLPVSMILKQENRPDGDLMNINVIMIGRICFWLIRQNYFLLVINICRVHLSIYEEDMPRVLWRIGMGSICINTLRPIWLSNIWYKVNSGRPWLTFIIWFFIQVPHMKVLKILWFRGRIVWSIHIALLLMRGLLLK